MQGTIGETLAIVATIDPKDVATTAASSDWVDMKKWRRLSAIIGSGVLSGTLDAKLEQATDASGTGVKDITGKAITTLAATDDNKQAVISIEDSDLDTDNSFNHVRCTVTPTGGVANFAAAILLATDGVAPVADHDLASVAEIV